jgi:hypothetical protein
MNADISGAVLTLVININGDDTLWTTAEHWLDHDGAQWSGRHHRCNRRPIQYRLQLRQPPDLRGCLAPARNSHPINIAAGAMLAVGRVQQGSTLSSPPARTFENRHGEAICVVVPIMSHLREIAEKYFRVGQTHSASSWLCGLAAAYGNATDRIETVEIATRSLAPGDGLVFEDASTLISMNRRARTAGQ